MGNVKSSACMPICGEREETGTNQRKHGKFKKVSSEVISKGHKAKDNLKEILEEEAYERF